MKKSFVYVGHSNWGKSFALKQLTQGSSRIKIATIKNQLVWVRKMSNDDQPEGLLEFVKSISKNWYTNFILAYCPNHESDELAMAILKVLQDSCELYFFIQESKYDNADAKIKQQEMNYLKKIGTVKIIKGKQEDKDRAKRFLSFIEQHI